MSLIKEPESQRFEHAVSILLKHEGGFSNNKADPGGATIYGVSLRYLKASGIDINLDGKIDITDIMALDKAHAKAIYKRYWWDKYQYGSIENLSIATKILDLAVNMGPIQAHKLVQRAVNIFRLDIEQTLIIDGHLGKKSIAAINQLGKLRRNEALLTAIKRQASQFYRNIVATKPELRIFLKGWLRRAAD